MKFAIILLSCLAVISCVPSIKQDGEDRLAEGFRWGRHWDSNRLYECQFVSELQVISCFRGLVECETIPRFEGVSQNFELFAVSSNDLINFQLNPRNLKDLKHLDSKVALTTGGVAELRLFSSEQQSLPNVRGFMVKDTQCYKRIVDLFKVVRPTQELLELANGQKVSVFGYINYLLGDLEQHPRHESEDRFEVRPFGKSTGQEIIRQNTKSMVLPIETRWGLEDSTRRFDCKYVAESEVLSCFRGLVKCETVSRLEELKNTYEVFGLGTTDMINYHLYPRKLSEVKYSDYRVPTVNGKMVELSLFRTGVEGTGLMVRDAVCYQRIVDFLRVANVPTMVDIEGDNTDAKVSMMGYILSQQQPQGQQSVLQAQRML